LSARSDGLDGISLRLRDSRGTTLDTAEANGTLGDAVIRWTTPSASGLFAYLIVSSADDQLGDYTVFVSSRSLATATPTPAPTAVSTSGTRWIAGTGGIGVKSRQDCTANADTSGSGLAQGTQVSLELRGQARCDGWYRVNSAGRLVWVESKYLSTAEPTPVPQTGSGAAAPVITAICVDFGHDNSADCRASALNGIRLAQMDLYGLITWSIADDVDLTSYAVDGKVIDFYYADFSVLALGRHTIQIYDPPGGDYEGWSTTIAFTLVP